MEKFLAIDFGTKRVGLAISVASLAEPLKIVNHDQAIDEIIKICKAEGITQLVLGVSEAEMANKISVFEKKLREKIDLPINLIDETLSSQEVAARLKAAHVPLRKRQAPIDHYAAAIILEDWLELHSDLC